MFLSNIFNLDFNKIKDVAAATNGQTMNVLWCNIHIFRLTSSNFGLVLRAFNRNRYPPSLFQTVMENIIWMGCIQWGKQHESTTIRKLEKDFSCTVQKTRLWLSDCGTLVASPDAIMLNS